jgi:hypothetical protein
LDRPQHFEIGAGGQDGSLLNHAIIAGDE